MLDQICNDYAGYVVAVEWHVSSAYPLYSAEARAKWFMYPPPYSGSYATPWLWVDGRQRGYQYSRWAGYVASQITVPTPVRISLTGSYQPATRTGSISAVIQNDSSADITARVSVVITEDSCYYAGPNGDAWHNHVCRDYIPDQSGTVVTVPAGGVDTVNQDFTLASGWNEQRCKVVVYAQSTTMVPADSSYPAFQGAEVRVLDLVGVREDAGRGTRVTGLRVAPNPCRGRVRFAFTAAPGVFYHLNLYTADGRRVKGFSGVTQAEQVITADGLEPGVYVYRLSIGGRSYRGRLVVTALQ